MAEKYKIEIEAIKEALKTVFKQKYLSEFLRVKQDELNAQNAASKKTKKLYLESKAIENDIESLV